MDDPLGDAASALMGVHYLYPYQRLVVANILEAALNAGVPLRPDLETDLGLVGLTEAMTSEEILDRDAAELGKEIVILPTGAGKSLCFQLPALMLDRPTLVIYPILSLMADQQRRLSERGFEPALLRGGQSRVDREGVLASIRSGRARFVIANPEVLLTPEMLKELPGFHIGHMVVDEAHCVSEWGESFRPTYLRIAEIAQACGSPIVTAFTATASPEVLEKIRTYVFGDRGARLIAGDPDRANIFYRALGTLAKDRAVAGLLNEHPRPAIVFCSSRTGTEDMALYLRRELRTDQIFYYHAGMEREEKNWVERWFFSSDDGILCATTAYGMGVDKANIRTVIHRDCPPNVEAYLQESGRAGRDGLPAQGILLFGPEDQEALKRKGEGYNKRRFAELLRYATEVDRCRRERLLALLGVEATWCSGCDVCAGDAAPGFREEGPIVSFIYRNNRRWTFQEASQILASVSPWRLNEEEARASLSRLITLGSVGRASQRLWEGRLVARRPGYPLRRVVCKPRMDTVDKAGNRRLDGEERILSRIEGDRI